MIYVTKYICKGKTEHCKEICHHGEPHEQSSGCGITMPCKFGTGLFLCRQITEEKIKIDLVICQETNTCVSTCNHKTTHQRNERCHHPCGGRICVRNPKVLTAKHTAKATRYHIRMNIRNNL